MDCLGRNPGRPAYVILAMISRFLPLLLFLFPLARSTWGSEVPPKVIADFSLPGVIQAWKPSRPDASSSMKLGRGPEGLGAVELTLPGDKATKPGGDSQITFSLALDGPALGGVGFTRLTFWHKGGRSRTAKLGKASCCPCRAPLRRSSAPGIPT
jgi:hypothetical protein